MIIFSKNGSLVLYWNNTLMCGFPLSKSNLLISYFNQAEDVLKRYLKEGSKFKDIKKQFTMYCDNMYKRKMSKQKIISSDWQLFCCCVLILIRIKAIEFDDHILIAPRKKNLKHNRKHYFFRESNEKYYRENQLWNPKVKPMYLAGASQYVAPNI